MGDKLNAEGSRPSYEPLVSTQPSDFKAMLGMIDWGTLTNPGLLKPDSPQGKVRFGLPQHAPRLTFMQLWLEADSASV